MKKVVLRKNTTLSQLSARYHIPICMIIRANTTCPDLTRGSVVLIPDPGYCTLLGSCESLCQPLEEEAIPAVPSFDGPQEPHFEEDDFPQRYIEKYYPD